MTAIRIGPGVKVFATGWGQLEEGKGRGFQAELTQVDLVTVRLRLAHRLPGQDRRQHDVRDRRPTTTPAPATAAGRWCSRAASRVLVGIVSWGIGCYREDSAGVYVRIDRDHYRDWIDRAMAADPSINELR